MIRTYIEPLVMFATLLRGFLLASLTGIVVGTGTSFFLFVLSYFLGKSSHLPLWIQMALLPIGGILNGLIIHFGYRNSAEGKKDSTIAAVHEQSGIMPYKTFLFKPIAAIITLASGGSAGKEGPCSHIGGMIASWFGQFLHLNLEMQKKILASGVSAGFASVFGTPIAGAIYGVEVLAIGRLRHDFIFTAVTAGITSFEVSKMWGVRYTYYPFHISSYFSEIMFIKMLIIGLFCGMISWFFIELYEKVRYVFRMVQKRVHIWPPLMPFLGGIILSILILFIPTEYLGLSLPLMDRALHGDQMPWLALLWKSLFVAITLGSGFYGGIVTPQFVLGAVSGNLLAALLGINPAIGAAVGMTAVVASASNTPIAAIFMGFELFGSTVGVYVVGACITAYIMIGHRSVYPDQLVVYPKSLWISLKSGISLENEKIAISYGLLRKVKRMYRRRKARYPGQIPK